MVELLAILVVLLLLVEHLAGLHILFLHQSLRAAVEDTEPRREAVVWVERILVLEAVAVVKVKIGMEAVEAAVALEDIQEPVVILT
jgi:hypothetical protein